MRGGGTKRAVRSVLLRLGLQTPAAEVVRTLACYGVTVGVELVRAVRLELHKEAARAERQRAKGLPVVMPVRRGCRKVPPRRPSQRPRG
jgi:hypothetical protein